MFDNFRSRNFLLNNKNNIRNNTNYHNCINNTTYNKTISYQYLNMEYFEILSVML